MSDNKRVGGKANDGKNGTRRRKYLQLKKKLRQKAKKEAGLKLSKKTKRVDTSKPITKSVIKKPVAKKSATKKSVAKKSVAKKSTTKKSVAKKSATKKSVAKKSTTKKTSK